MAIIPASISSSSLLFFCFPSRTIGVSLYLVSPPYTGSLTLFTSSLFLPLVFPSKCRFGEERERWSYCLSLFSCLPIRCGFVWFCFLISIRSFWHYKEIHSTVISSVTTKELPSCLRVKLQQKFKIATCCITLCYAFLLVDGEGDRNLLHSLRQRM